uniref:Peptidase A2 domain-containing protein n=1 Tax=Papio anubis TaxID=9555 RepID=A0A8I5R595_PAPAN
CCISASSGPNAAPSTNKFTYSQPRWVPASSSVSVQCLSTSTVGGGVVDLCSIIPLNLLPNSLPLIVPTGVTGPLPQGSVGLVLGRASTSAKGITIHTGLINSDSSDEIKLTVSAKVPVSIPARESFAQVLLLHNIVLNKGDKTRGPGMGSSGEKTAYWINVISKQQPTCSIHIQGRKFEGPEDTGADVSIISSNLWPSCWLKHPANVGLVGVGKADEVHRNTFILPCTGPDGQEGTIQPHIMPIPVVGKRRDQPVTVT